MRKGEPVAATGILEQLFNASNLAIVGNFTGDARTVEVAAVGANSPIIGLPAGIQSAVFPRYRTPSVPQKIAGGRT